MSNLYGQDKMKIRVKKVTSNLYVLKSIVYILLMCLSSHILYNLLYSYNTHIHK